MIFSKDNQLNLWLQFIDEKTNAVIGNVISFDTITNRMVRAKPKEDGTSDFEIDPQTGEIIIQDFIYPNPVITMVKIPEQHYAAHRDYIMNLVGVVERFAVQKTIEGVKKTPLKQRKT